jgi:hypothetical protein
VEFWASVVRQRLNLFDKPVFGPQTRKIATELHITVHKKRRRSDTMVCAARLPSPDSCRMIFSTLHRPGHLNLVATSEEGHMRSHTSCDGGSLQLHVASLLASVQLPIRAGACAGPPPPQDGTTGQAVTGRARDLIHEKAYGYTNDGCTDKAVQPDLISFRRKHCSSPLIEMWGGRKSRPSWLRLGSFSTCS